MQTEKKIYEFHWGEILRDCLPSPLCSCDQSFSPTTLSVGAEVVLQWHLMGSLIHFRHNTPPQWLGFFQLQSCEDLGKKKGARIIVNLHICGKSCLTQRERTA